MRETGSGILLAGTGSPHFLSASSEAEIRDARDFSRGRFTPGIVIITLKQPFMEKQY
jgi:hypothetical protein